MPTETFRVWGWEKPPYLDCIAKSKDALATHFLFRDSLLNKTKTRLMNLTNSRGIIVAGRPGVGKTTFLKYLEHVVFPSKMRVISLAERMGYVGPSGYAALSTEQFLHVFSDVEQFLLKILNDNNITPSIRVQSSIINQYEKNINGGNGDQTKEELVRDTILPLCKDIKKHHEKLPTYFLAIDDVDYLYPTDQGAILAVICDIIINTSNPIILYSARPAAAGIAKNHLKSYITHNFGSPIEVEPLDVFEVIQSRLKKISIDQNCCLGPFSTNKEQVRTFLNNISNHNIRYALSVADHLQLVADEYTEKPDYQYNYQALIKALYGKPSISKTSYSDSENDRYIQNIFRARTPCDSVPFDYIILVLFANPRNVNEHFMEDFNSLCYKINPQNVPQNGYSDTDIVRFVKSSHDHDFISRIDRLPYETFKDKSDWENLMKIIWYREFCLTPKGVMVLNLSKDRLYQELGALESWRKLVTEAIKGMKYKIKTLDLRNIY